MIDYYLFFGLALDKSLQEVLNKAPDNLKQLYIMTDSEYLQEITFQGDRYLGKSIGNLVDIKKLTLIQKNIESLLKKISPDFSDKSLSFSLFPLKSAKLGLV